MTVELWTIDGDNETVEEIIAILRFTLGAAQESEVVRPETVSALRKWCNAEWNRIHPTEYVKVDREAEHRAALQRSRFWPFWESLQAEQEVRWTKTKTATYFVVDPNPVTSPPDSKYNQFGMFIELRRHTGKTFWTHIGQVRPLDHVDA